MGVCRGALVKDGAQRPVFFFNERSTWALNAAKTH
jgi:hypothetical protein